MVKADGPNTVITIVDRDPDSDNKGKEVSSIKVAEFINLLKIQSLATPVASGEKGAVDFRRVEFERGLISAFRDIGIPEESQPEIVYQ